MSVAAPLIDNMYRHENGLKHINIVNNEGFSALFVVNTPIIDDSGVAHGVEHGVFRRSLAFENPETLFQLTALTDAKINASTFADTTYFHCQSPCEYTFNLAIEYLLNGLFSPVFDEEYLNGEVYDGKVKGVIYRELIGIEHTKSNNEIKEKKEISETSEIEGEFNYGGVSSTIGDLTLKEIRAFHQRFYQASNITLVTANADIENISTLISRLSVQVSQAQTSQAQNNQNHSLKNKANVEIKKTSKNRGDNNETERYQAKYSPAINTLINAYYLTLNTANCLHFEQYKSVEDEALTVDIKGQVKAESKLNLKLKPKSKIIQIEKAAQTAKAGVIAPLVSLADKISDAVNAEQTFDTSAEISVGSSADTSPVKRSKAESASQPLPKLFTSLCLKAKQQFVLNHSANKNLTSKELSQNEHQKSHTKAVSVYDQHNALWLIKISKKEQAIANITSYILSAYPAFIARRCEGFCYAIQALTIEDSAYLAIYSAFDVAPVEQINTISPCLLTLSEDMAFISQSLALAKIKYGRVHQVTNRNVADLSPENIVGYLQRIAKD
ncbi:MAG: hypothetical protein V7736_09290 [Colwellia polaris]|mgnify:CR=1 FL=1|jgi:nitrate reductase cytochrome c-type subunit|tara:strand:+ start:285 stop:1952 length:1668 start_codon:yes stop_codon:yes gene_type:complete